MGMDIDSHSPKKVDKRCCMFRETESRGKRQSKTLKHGYRISLIKENTDQYPIDSEGGNSVQHLLIASVVSRISDLSFAVHVEMIFLAALPQRLLSILIIPNTLLKLTADFQKQGKVCPQN